jgi:hypothetical protein
MQALWRAAKNNATYGAERLDNVFEPPVDQGRRPPVVSEALAFGWAAIEAHAGMCGHIRVTAEHMLATVFTQPEVVWGLHAQGLNIKQADQRVHECFDGVPSYANTITDPPMILEVMRISKRAGRRCDGVVTGTDLLAALIDDPIPWWMWMRAQVFGHRDWRAAVLELPLQVVKPVSTPPTSFTGEVLLASEALSAVDWVSVLTSLGVFPHIAVRLWLTTREAGMASVPDGVSVDVLKQFGVSVRTAE